MNKNDELMTVELSNEMKAAIGSIVATKDDINVSDNTLLPSRNRVRK